MLHSIRVCLIDHIDRSIASRRLEFICCDSLSLLFACLGEGRGFDPLMLRVIFVLGAVVRSFGRSRGRTCSFLRLRTVGGRRADHVPEEEMLESSRRGSYTLGRASRERGIFKYLTIQDMELPGSSKILVHVFFFRFPSLSTASAACYRPPRQSQYPLFFSSFSRRSS